MPDMKKNIHGIKVYPLHLGNMWSDSCVMYANDTYATLDNPHAPNRLSHNPSTAYLIEHPSAGWILFDTGMPDDPETQWPAEMLKTVGVEKPEGTRMVDQLALVGLKPQDVRYVVSSHLHMDHIGNDNLFADTAEFIVSRKEAIGAYLTCMTSTNPLDHGFYIAEEVLQPRKKITYVEKDVEQIFPGITAFVLPGHTAGTMGLLVQMDGGNLFLAEDVVYLERNLKDNTLPGNTYDSVGYRRGLKRVREIQSDFDAQVMYGHDWMQFEKMPMAPHYFS